VLQIDAASLVVAGSVAVVGKDVFSIFAVPNSIGLLSDRLVAMFGANTLFLRDHALQEKQRFTLSGPTAIIAMAGQNAIGLLCLKEERVGQNTKYSYSYSRKKIS
jgi:hypothetical protein